MKPDKLIRILNNKEELDSFLEDLMKKKILFMQEPNKNEIRGHLAKSEHNLSFAGTISSEYNDWLLVAYYYSLYHAALSLLMAKGFVSKNHDATMCVIIKYYYEKPFSKQDFELLNEFFLDADDLLFYARARNKREEASYSTKLRFDKQDIGEVKVKTMLLIEKMRRIIQKEMQK